MKALLKRLQLQFNSPVQVGHTIDNFIGEQEPVRVNYYAYVQIVEPFINTLGKPSHTLERDNLSLLKADVKEQIANWYRKQAEEAEITEVDFEDNTPDHPGYEERDDTALEQLNNEL